MRVTSPDRENKHPDKRRARGFTIIELLVVIAIIALLAAILLPVFRSARERARAASCESNMKQLGMAFQQYLQDNGRKFPGAGNFQDWGKGGHWVKGVDGAELADIAAPYTYKSPNRALPDQGALYPYVKNVNLYVCPSNSDGKNKGLTYSMNCAIGGLNDVRIREPADIILLVDEDKANDAFFYAVPLTTSTDALAQYHNGGGNMLFCDYHAKFIPFNTFPLDNNAANVNNKGRMTGSPRFHDRAFGSPGGSNINPGKSTDSCAVAVP